MRNLDILAAESGEHVRVLLCREEQSYVVSCQHFRMPYPVASDLLAELQPVPAEAYSVFVLDEDITNRQREGRNRKLDLIAPLLDDTCIYDKSHRNEVVRQIAAEHNIARRTVLQYLWRYWVYQSKNALLPAERPAPEQHELTTDEKAIRWALNKYYYTPQRQSLQTAYKMMLRAKYCDAHGTLKPEYPTFWQFRYFFRKNRDPISETISRQGLKAYQRNHRPFTGSVCDYAHPDNFALDWQRWNGHRNFFQLLRGQVYNLCSFRYALLLGKEVIRLEPICNILRVLIVPKNSCMSTCHNLLITKPDNTLAYIFYIFARNSNNQIAFVYFLQFFSQFMGYK